MADQQVLLRDLELFAEHARFSVSQLGYIRNRLKEETNRISDIFYSYEKKRQELFFRKAEEKGLSWCTCSNPASGICKTKLIPKSQLRTILVQSRKKRMHPYSTDYIEEKRFHRVTRDCLKWFKENRGRYGNPGFFEGEYYHVFSIFKKDGKNMYVNQFGTMCEVSDQEIDIPLSDGRLADMVRMYKDNFSLGPDSSIRVNSLGCRYSIGDSEVFLKVT